MRYSTRALALFVLAALGACSIDGVTFTGGTADGSTDSPKDSPMADTPPMGPLGIVVSAGANVMVREGQTLGAMIMLSQAPTGPVLVTLESTDDTRIGISPTAVLFSATDWNVPQSVTLTGKQDADAADETGKITLRSTAVATPYVVNVTVDDDDGLTLALSATSLDVGEGSTGTLSAHLTAQPASTVTVTVMSTNTAAATTSQSTLVFTTANWAIDQTITITGLQDADTINNMLSIDFTAALLMSTSLPIQVTDDDVLGISTSTSSLAVTEGANQTFTVQLTQMPTASTTVMIAPASATVATVSPGSLMFTTANWNTPQTVTLTAVQDDDVVNGSTTLMLTATGLAPRTVSVSVTEDDVQAIVTSPATNLAVTEGSTAQLAVSMAFRPTANVTMSVESLDLMAATVNPATLTFTTANFNVPQMVTVTGVQDADALPDITTVHIEALALSLVRDVNVNVADDEVLLIDATPNPVAVTEGSTANLMIRLTAQPSTSTTVSIMSSAPAAAITTPTSVVFTTSNWNVFQTVSVNGVEDGDLSGATATLTLSATGLPNATVLVNVTDNDMQAVIPATSPVTVTEGTSTSVGVTLSFMPTSNVTVNVGSMDGAVATASPSTLTFSPTNYNTPQNISISGTQDANAVNNTTMVTLTATGATTGTITVNVTDDDGLNIELTPTTLMIGEAGSGMLQVRLTAMPAAATTVMLVSSDTTAATVSTSMLTFTTTNYNMYQTVTISGVDDLDAGNETVTLTASATGVPNATATVNVTDDEVQTILTSVPNVSLTEGSMTTFGVRLGAQPGGNVTVNINSGNIGSATVSPAMLTFTPANYATNQLVTVMAVEDANAADEAVTIGVSSTGVATVNVIANVDDNDTQAVLVSSSSINVPEGLTRNVNVTLAFQPTSNLTVTVTSADDQIATGMPGILTFTPGNYATPQVLVIRGTEDADITDESTSIALTAPGATAASVTANVTDNDMLGIEVTPTALDVFENAADTLSVRLTAAPAGTVMVNVSSSNSNKVSTSTGLLSFNASNWNVYQGVTVFGVNDTDSNDENEIITFSSPSATTQTASIAVIDDDNIFIQAPSQVTVVEGNTAQIGIRLSSPPVGSVTVDVTSLDPSKASVSPATLTFTASDYNIPKTVFVHGEQDGDIVDEVTSISLTSPGIPSESVTVDVRDDDSQGIEIDSTDLRVAEGVGGSINVRLRYEPQGTVFVNVASDDMQVQVSPMILMFDSSNYFTGLQVQIMTFADADFDEVAANISFSGPGPVVSTTVTVVEQQIIRQPDFGRQFICEGQTVPLEIALQGVPAGPYTLGILTGPSLSSGTTQVTLASTLPQTISITGVMADTSASLSVIGPGMLFPRMVSIQVLSAQDPFCPFL